MSFWRKIVGGIGDVAKYAAPVLALTGVGAPLAAGVAAAGGALGTLNDKDQQGRYRKASLGRALKHAAGHGVAGALGAGIPSAGGPLAAAKTVAGATAKMTPAQALLASQAMGTGLQAFGQYQMGRVEDQIRRQQEEDRLRERERLERYAPLFAGMLNRQLGGGM
ncbi:MAG TPA: hypothetical protein VNZ57_12575 [Longimicrobiales bacterium]|nr:hypothetical protein [Longimicrobiales bacterium]